MNDALADELNTYTLKERLEKLGGIEFDKVNNETFAGNLDFIDTQFDKILAEMLRLYYCERINDCAELATELEERDPLNLNVEDFYRINIKEFLCAVALGMKPNQKWNGTYEANGGCIIVQKDGKLVAYPLHDIDEFKTDLLNGTRLDTPKTGKHKFGTVCKTGGGCYCIDLNLQIRFKNNPRTS